MPATKSTSIDIEQILTDLLNEAEKYYAPFQYVSWSAKVAEFLRAVFGPEKAAEFEKLTGKDKDAIHAAKQGYVLALRFNLTDELKQIPPRQTTQRSPELGEVGAVRANSALSPYIFIVHGHNKAIKETVARFVDKLDLKPIILHEQANAGRTIIEKFEEFSGVSYAIVLLTADDVGASKQNGENLRPRTRQNVIFELGFFIGRLGRRRVCSLYEENVELPSDYQGMLYIPLDATGAWKLELLKEMKAVGLPVNLEGIL